MKTNKAQELPVNIIVMIIIGIIIFGLGMSLFSKINKSGESQVSNINNKIKNDIASLECDGGEWICAPSYKIKNGNNKVFSVYVANRGTTTKKFSINIETTPTQNDGKPSITRKGCGSVLVYYPKILTNVISGESASFPVQIIASRVTNTPCSFTTIAELKDENNKIIAKTPVIIRVE